MPWFPDFVAAAELVRRDRQVAGQADPVARYLRTLTTGDAHDLEAVWPGRITVFDPLAGEVRGHRQLARFAARSGAWLADHVVGTETIASTTTGGRAVVELLAQVDQDGRRSEWPVAVVAESHDERSVVFRTYCTQLPVVGKRPVRGPILDARRVELAGVVAQYQSTLEAGDIEAIVADLRARRLPARSRRPGRGPRRHRRAAPRSSPAASARAAGSSWRAAA